MSETRNKILDGLNLLFDKVDESLSEWDFASGNFPIPTLIGMVAVKLNVAPEKVRKIDPIIRHYIDEHPEYNSKRGSGGGVEKTSLVADRKAAKENAKREARSRVEGPSAEEASEDSTESDESITTSPRLVACS